MSTVANVEPIIQGVMQTPDGYWTVQIVRYGRKMTWFRVLHATTVVEEKASLGTVQRILGDAFETLQSAVADGNASAAG